MSTDAATRIVHVTNRHGLHIRPCMAIVNVVQKYQAAVKIQKNGQAANAGSILELITLGAPQGTELTVTAQGPQAEAVLNELEKLFAHEFEVLYD